MNINVFFVRRSLFYVRYFWQKTTNDEQSTKNIEHMNIEDLPINWNDHEDIAMKLYDRFGDDFTESKIYRIRFTELLDWILEIPTFEGKREDSNEGHLEQIQAKWVYEWRDNQWVNVEWANEWIVMLQCDNDVMRQWKTL